MFENEKLIIIFLVALSCQKCRSQVLFSNLLLKTKNLFGILSKDVRLLSNKTVYVDKTLINFWYDIGNETHYGANYCNVVEEIPVINLRVILSSSEKTIIDFHINVCTWLKNKRIEYIINLIKFLDPVINKEFLKCPWKKGKFTILKARLAPKTVEEFGGIPLFVPIKGKFNLTLVGKTKIRKRIRQLFNHYQLFELS